MPKNLLQHIDVHIVALVNAQIDAGLMAEGEKLIQKGKEDLVFGDRLGKIMQMELELGEKILELTKLRKNDFSKIQEFRQDHPNLIILPPNLIQEIFTSLQSSEILLAPPHLKTFIQTHLATFALQELTSEATLEATLESALESTLKSTPEKSEDLPGLSSQIAQSSSIDPVCIDGVAMSGQEYLQRLQKDFFVMPGSQVALDQPLQRTTLLIVQDQNLDQTLQDVLIGRQASDSVLFSLPRAQSLPKLSGAFQTIDLMQEDSLNTLAALQDQLYERLSTLFVLYDTKRFEEILKELKPTAVQHLPIDQLTTHRIKRIKEEIKKIKESKPVFEKPVRRAIRIVHKEVLALENQILQVNTARIQAIRKNLTPHENAVKYIFLDAGELIEALKYALDRHVILNNLCLILHKNIDPNASDQSIQALLDVLQEYENQMPEKTKRFWIEIKKLIKAG